MKPEAEGAFPFPMTLFGDPQCLIRLIGYCWVRIVCLCVVFLVFISMHNEDVIDEVRDFARALDIKFIWPRAFATAFSDMVDQVDVYVGGFGAPT